jgi:hypothetical protein
MSKRSRSKANIPIHRESLSCLLPCPPILPSLPSLYKCRARSTNRPFFAKQSQFQNGQYKRKYSNTKGLYQ